MTTEPQTGQTPHLEHFSPLLPSNASPFMTSLIASCSDDIFKMFQRVDSWHLPSHPSDFSVAASDCPFIAVVDGRLLIDISLLADLAQSWGVPDSFLLDRPESPQQSINFGRMVRHLIPILRLTRARLSAPSIAMLAVEPIIADACQPFETFGAAIDVAQALYSRYSRITLMLSGSASVLVALLRRLGTLNEHNGRYLTLRLMMRSDIFMMRYVLTEEPSARAALESGEIPSEGVFGDSWRLHLDRYGHRGNDELDLAQPRYAEQPETLIHALLAAEDEVRLGGAMPKQTLRGLLTLPIWRVAAHILGIREQFRHSTMYAFAHLRNELLRLANHAVARGQITSIEAIWSMSIEEVRDLDA